MALNKVQLKADIKAAFDAQKNKTSNPDAAIDDIADKIATAIDNYVKTITITSTPALVAGPVPVTGTIVNTVI